MPGRVTHLGLCGTDDDDGLGGKNDPSGKYIPEMTIIDTIIRILQADFLIKSNIDNC